MYPTRLNISYHKPASRIVVMMLLFFRVIGANAQAVTEIITDYGGYWKTSASNVNSVKPDNNHNLLSFSYNGTRYSTGVNDAALTARGDAFTPAVFRALPMSNFTGTITSNTKIGMGALADGVANGTGGTPPSRSLGQYLNDGVNGLNLGTGVANLPAGNLFLSVNNLQTGLIGDGVPDILVTQIADPSSLNDRYEFTDINGNRVGNSLSVVLSNITPVGNWMADFFEATGSQVLGSGFTQTQRPLRLWAADLSAFGINASNINSIAYFKITLSGDSDVAFVAYNTTTINVSQVLDLRNDGPVMGRSPRQTPSAEKKFVAFPNPAMATINVSHLAARGTEQLRLYNMQGILVRQVTVERGSTLSRIDVQTLRPGTYQLVFVNNEFNPSQLIAVAS